jgi:sortase B
MNDDIDKKSRLRRIISGIVPLRGDNKREIIRKILLLASVVVLIIGLWLIISYYAENYMNRQEYASIAKQYASAVSSEPTPTVSGPSSESQMLPQFESLYKQNNQIKGFITIAKANINLPVVQAADNGKYLDTGFDGKPSRDGTAFLDYRDSIKPLSQNLIVYSHNMQDGQMFAGLESYVSNGKNNFLDFYNSAPIIKFDTLYEQSQWKIFAVFATMADSTAPNSIYYLNTSFDSADAFNNYIKAVRQRSFINTNVDVNYGDNLLTLSTCNYDYPKINGDYARFVVLARKLRPGESATVTPATINQNVVYPKPWVDLWNPKSSAPSTNYDLTKLNIVLPTSWHLDTSAKVQYFFVDDKGVSRGWVISNQYTDNFVFPQPNHSSITNDEYIDIPLGSCRLYTLNSDNGTAAQGITGTHDDYYAVITLKNKVIYVLEFSLNNKNSDAKKQFIDILDKLSLKT